MKFLPLKRMKISRLTILPALCLFICSFYMDKNEPPVETWKETGIMLDTMNNQVMLAFEDQIPAYYYCNIFTPVCNTGECLPVKINLYWDLDGNYQRFDQPEGEMLTKSDHVPFTENDYQLLHEILLDPSDPRHVAQQPKHSMIEGSQQANPAPGAFRVFTKYEMVDGVTGSTLPEIKDKFVPGALYTTYTLWGLAHDAQAHLKNYTNFYVITPEYYHHFLTSDNSPYADQVIYSMMGNRQDKNPWASVCIDLLDTGNVDLQFVALNKFRPDDYQDKKVQKALHKKFFALGDTTMDRTILKRWESYGISDESLLELSNEIMNLMEYMEEMAAIFASVTLTEEVFENIITVVPEMYPRDKQTIIDMLKEKKNELSKKQWKRVKNL